MWHLLIYLAVSFCASVVGAICGIGGGVVIKPVLDLCGLAGVSTISFLSGCTVLSMSCYSVVKSRLAGENGVDGRTGTPLALGAAVGGVAGKWLFDAIKALFASPNTVGAVQAACLALITLGTLVYTVFKRRVRTRRVTNRGVCAAIGLALGLMSSFLGIGGGPINLVVLFYFFSMDTKTAAQNSLYIILFSQIASLLTTLISGKVPGFSWLALVFMVCGGICGGVVGRKVNKRMDERAVDRLFMGLMALIICISVFNAFRYAGA